MLEDLVVVCADVGSVSAGNFGWAAMRDGVESVLDTGTSMEGVANLVVRELGSGSPVALGFECPLFIPFRENPGDLTRQRNGEKGRPWSAGAGCGSLTTGLIQSAWILDHLAKATKDLRPTLNWESFAAGHSPLLLWEAFVSGASKAVDGDSLHEADAELGAKAFINALPNVPAVNAVREDEVYSLIGAALLKSGMRQDLGVLGESCIVIRA